MTKAEYKAMAEAAKAAFEGKVEVCKPQRNGKVYSARAK